MGIAFDQVVIIMLENAVQARVLKNQYMRELRHKGMYLSKYYGVTHSSQPNYIASVAGDTMTFWNDSFGYARWVYESLLYYTAAMKAGSDVKLEATCIANLFDTRDIGWANYIEDLPSDYHQRNADTLQYNLNILNDYARDVSNPEKSDSIPPPQFQIVDDTYPFARKHAPFLSFPNLIRDVEYAKEHMVNASAFDPKNLPPYSFYTANMINDGHDLKDGQETNEPGTWVSGDLNPLYIDPNIDTKIDNIADFLGGFLTDDPSNHFAPGTLIVVTFDEGYPYHLPNHVYTVLLGDVIEPYRGTVDDTPYNHYSLLRTIEDNFDLGTLGRNDAVARPFKFTPTRRLLMPREPQ